MLHMRWGSETVATNLTLGLFRNAGSREAKSDLYGCIGEQPRGRLRLTQSERHLQRRHLCRRRQSLNTLGRRHHPTCLPILASTA